VPVRPLVLCRLPGGELLRRFSPLMAAKNSAEPWRIKPGDLLYGHSQPVPQSAAAPRPAKSSTQKFPLEVHGQLREEPVVSWGNSSRRGCSRW